MSLLLFFTGTPARPQFPQDRFYPGITVVGIVRPPGRFEK